MEIRLPKLTSYQKAVVDWLGDPYCQGKTAVVKSIRQSGKSFLCQVVLISVALNHTCTSIVVEPTLEQSRNMYKHLDKALSAAKLIAKSNAQTLTIQTINGSEIIFKSTQQDDEALRGYTCTGVLVLDECAYLLDEQIYTILPMVNAKNASMLMCSTPFIPDGFFYKMYNEGIINPSDKLKSFDWSKEKETERFLTPERKEFFRKTMSPQKYQTEVLGEFLTSEGLLFAGFDECVKEPTHPTGLFIGIDFAAGDGGDYTVLTALNHLGEMYQQIRTNNLTPMQQVDWLYSNIENLARQAPIRRIVGEKNSIGVIYIDALNQRLKKLGLQITEFVTTNDSKRQLVESLQLAFQNKNIGIMSEPELFNELRRYEADVNPTTKTIRYNGKGAHDDMVMSLMLSWYGYKNNVGNYTYSFL